MAATASCAACLTASGVPSGRLDNSPMRILVAALAHDADGLELFGLAGVGLEQDHRGVGFDQRFADGRDRLLLDRGGQRFQHAGVLGFEHRPRRVEAPRRIGRQKRQAAHRGVDAPGGRGC